MPWGTRADDAGALAPKISLPRAPAFSLARDRLVDGLERARSDGKVVLVCAPMGYGKTVLLSHWAAQLRADGAVVAWVTCEAGDDVHSLWSAVASAIAVGVDRAGLAPAALEAPETPAVAGATIPAADLPAPADPVLASVARRWRDLAHAPPGMPASHLGTVSDVLTSQQTPVVLVLDDVHTVVDASTRASIAALLTQRSDRLTVVLAARHDPLVDLSRVRLRGDLHEVRADLLACTVEEADAVLRAAGTPLSATALQLVHARTEGWPAGLRLVGLALAGEDRPDDLVDDFAVDHRIVADYLVDSLLNLMDDPSRELLRRVSIVDAVTGPLATALTGDDAAGRRLDQLEREGALVARLGRAGRWYRCHALLRAYLLADLRATDPGLYRSLHAAASRWHLTEGNHLPALEHAAQSSDVDLLDEVACAAAPPLLLRGAGAAVRRALEPAPDDGARTPAVAAVLALSRDDRSSSGPTLGGPPGAGQGVPGPRASPVPAPVSPRVHMLQRAARLRLGAQGVTEPLDDLDHTADRPSITPDQDTDVLALLLSAAAPRALASGDVALARRLYRRAADLADSHGYQQLHLEALTGSATSCLADGDARAATDAAGQALQLAGRRGWSGLAATGPAQQVAALAGLLQGTAHRGEPPDAASEPGCPASLVDVAVSLLAGDEPSVRRRALTSAGAWWTAGGTADPWIRSLATYAEVTVSLELGWVTRARQAVHDAEQRGLALPDRLVLRALLLSALDEPAAAAAAVDEALASTASPTHPVLTLGGLVVRARSASQRAMTAAADRAVLDALELASTTGILLPFSLGGPVCRDLVHGLTGRAGRLEETVQAVLALVRDPSPPAPAVVVDLTAREQDVLRELPSLLRMSEIAELQQVSLNTVKTHVTSLYRKLGVTDRRGAVDAARRLHLI